MGIACKKPLQLSILLYLVCSAGCAWAKLDTEPFSLNEKHAAPCTGKCDCEIRVGLQGRLTTYSAISDLSENACRDSCKSLSAHWDQRNLSTLCLYRGHVIGTDNVGLLDINWANCRIISTITSNQAAPTEKKQVDQRRTSRRICVRECANLVKSRVVDHKTINCEWDGTHLSDKEVAESRGLLP